MWVNITEFSILTLTPHFSNTMLYAVLFVQCVWKYVGVVEGNLYFFSGGERKEVKSSFAVFGFGGAECKGACGCAEDFVIGFVVDIGSI